LRNVSQIDTPSVLLRCNTEIAASRGKLEAPQRSFGVQRNISTGWGKDYAASGPADPLTLVKGVAKGPQPHV
jgi:hypothetical protein